MPSMGDHKLMHLSGLVQAAAAAAAPAEAGEEEHYEDALPVLPVAGAAQPPAAGNAAAAAAPVLLQPALPVPQAQPTQPSSYRATIMAGVQQAEAVEAGLRADKAWLEGINKKLTAGRRALKAQNCELGEKLAMAEGKAAELAGEKDELEQQLEARLTVLHEQEVGLAELRSELSGTKRKARAELEAERGKRRVVEQRVAQLEAQKGDAERAAADAGAALVAERGRMERAEARLQEAEQKLSHLKQLAATL